MPAIGYRPRDWKSLIELYQGQQQPTEPVNTNPQFDWSQYGTQPQTQPSVQEPDLSQIWRSQGQTFPEFLNSFDISGINATRKFQENPSFRTLLTAMQASPVLGMTGNLESGAGKLIPKGKIPKKGKILPAPEVTKLSQTVSKFKTVDEFIETHGKDWTANFPNHDKDLETVDKYIRSKIDKDPLFIRLNKERMKNVPTGVLSSGDEKIMAKQTERWNLLYEQYFNELKGKPSVVTVTPEGKIIPEVPVSAGQAIYRGAKGKGLPGEIPMPKPITTGKGGIPPVKPPEIPITKVTQPPYRQRILDAIEEQRKLYQQETKPLHQQQLAAKFENIAQIPAGGKEDIGLLRKALKGKLENPDTPIYHFDPADERQLYVDIDNYYMAKNQNERRLPTKDALLKLTDPEAWKLAHPEEEIKGWTPHETRYLKDVFGNEFVDKLIQNPALYRITKKANDIYYFLRYNALMSGKANLRNTLGNFVRSTSDLVETPLSVVGESPLRLIPGYKRSRFWGEMNYEALGRLQGFKQGVSEFLHTWQTGERMSESLSKFESVNRPIGGKVGYALDIPSIGMEAGDAIFRAPLRQGNLNKLAYREARKLGLKGEALLNKVEELKLNPDLAIEADKDMLSSLFREDTSFGKMVMGFRNWEIPKTGIQPLREAALFVRVPINIVGYGLARSPLAVVNPKMWANIATKNPRAADQLGRLMLGSAIATYGYILAKEGLLTGALPVKKSEQDAWQVAGKIPYAVRIGDKWIQYSQIPLLNTALFMAAQTYDRMTQDEANSLVYDIWGFLLDQTFVKGFGNLLDAVTNPDRYGQGFLKQFVPSLLPYSSALRVGAQTIDPTVRAPETIGQAVEATIPGLSQNVLAKENVLGQEMQRETPFWSPFNISTNTGRTWNGSGKKVPNFSIGGNVKKSGTKKVPSFTR